jgi:hypothetical protein
VGDVKIDHREKGWGGMEWINLAQDRVQHQALVKKIMYLCVPQDVGKFFSSVATGSFSRRAQICGVC